MRVAWDGNEKGMWNPKSKKRREEKRKHTHSCTYRQIYLQREKQSLKQALQ